MRDSLSIAVSLTKGSANRLCVDEAVLADNVAGRPELPVQVPRSNWLVSCTYAAVPLTSAACWQP